MYSNINVIEPPTNKVEIQVTNQLGYHDLPYLQQSDSNILAG